MIKTKSRLVALVIAVLVIIVSCNKKGEDEVYVVPNDFIGPVIVIFNQQDGAEKKYSSERKRIYEIPSSGILKTKFRFQEGWRDIDYEKSNGVSIRYLWPSDKIWDENKDNLKTNYKDSIYAYGGGYSEDYWFVIGSINDADSLRIELREKWKPFSKSKTMKKGESMGDVKNNKLLKN